MGGFVPAATAGYPVGVEKPDFGGTTAVYAYVRRRITPKVLWSAIGILLTALAGQSVLLKTTRSDIRYLEKADAEREQSVADMQKKLEILQDIRTDIAVIKSTMGEFKAEQDRQRAKWDRVEEVASLPPHARRR